MSDEPKKYPIAEVFTSPQGEGYWAGTLMRFIRLAGCSVGKKPVTHTDDGSAYKLFPILRTGNGAWECHTWDGRSFWCDTDFGTNSIMTADELVAGVPENVEHVCLTGGEPLIHDIIPLLLACWNRKLVVHLETSGTILLPEKHIPEAYSYRRYRWLWVTVSPKHGVLPEMLACADEVKLLVDAEFDADKAQKLLTSTVRSADRIVWIQPVNEELKLCQTNIAKCVELQHLHPEWRISVQLHKVLNVR